MAFEQLTQIRSEVLQLEKRIERVRELVSDADAEARVNEVSTRSPARSESRPRRWTGCGLKSVPEITAKVQVSLNLATKKEAEIVVKAVVAALEETLAENLGNSGFSVKLGSLGKFAIHHRPGAYRKISFTGERKMTRPKRKVKFIALGRLRQLEDTGARD